MMSAKRASKLAPHPCLGCLNPPCPCTTLTFLLQREGAASLSLDTDCYMHALDYTELPVIHSPTDFIRGTVRDPSALQNHRFDTLCLALGQTPRLSESSCGATAQLSCKETSFSVSAYREYPVYLVQKATHIQNEALDNSSRITNH